MNRGQRVNMAKKSKRHTGEIILENSPEMQHFHSTLLSSNYNCLPLTESFTKKIQNTYCINANSELYYI